MAPKDLKDDLLRIGEDLDTETLAFKDNKQVGLLVNAFVQFLRDQRNRGSREPNYCSWTRLFTGHKRKKKEIAASVSKVVQRKSEGIEADSCKKRV